MATELKRAIQDIKDLNRQSLKETTTQTASVMPVLKALGWDTTDPASVSQEDKAGGRVDIVLHIEKNPRVFIETKPGRQRRLTDKDKKQILRYCRNRIRFGVLTNGYVWYLYSNADAETTQPNDYAIEINFDNSTEQIEKIFEYFLSKAQVRYNYERVLEALFDERVDRVLSAKWEEMLQQGHASLARALKNEVKKELPERKASLDRCRKFIRQRSSMPASDRGVKKEKTSARVPPRKTKERNLSKVPERIVKKPSRVRMFGRTVEFNGWADMLRTFFAEVHKANSKYPADLTKDLSSRWIVQGEANVKDSWRPYQIAETDIWVSTNLNSGDIVRLCEDVCKVLGLPKSTFKLID